MPALAVGHFQGSAGARLLSIEILAHLWASITSDENAAKLNQSTNSKKEDPSNSLSSKNELQRIMCFLTLRSSENTMVTIQYFFTVSSVATIWSSQADEHQNGEGCIANHPN